MDKSMPWTIAKNTFAISAICATATGISNILYRHDRIGGRVVASAINSGISATIFFSLREFVVSPLFIYTLPFDQYERRRRDFGIEKSIFATQPMVLSDMQVSSARSSKLLDSAVSGAITGGIIRGLRTGTKSIMLSTLVSGGAVCMLLQLGYNELSIRRLKYLSRTNSMPTLTLPTIMESPPSAPSDDSGSWKETALWLLGVRRMSDEEYLERMKLQREQYIRRIKELERQREEKKNATETTK